MKKTSSLLLLLLVIGGALAEVSPVLAANEFSREKALEHLKVLAETIGPRPMKLKIFVLRALDPSMPFPSVTGCHSTWQPNSASFSAK